ncbi:hypothetical protein CEUSTIGMA_g155.t1 [Chlamydomonas eustigma]|uniref:DNA polymerase delta subunit 3 n=1 Tax=Chlamydomonas eustigma TaxID=1157962 RepID=A0A250WPS5_9CHLO|nr:hypothetical protein CEUSTIGMA_g155.t1 [Chlamydomonas eustigma]|eukprot:GAX72699.1 hypothetical protein CEUSTIGMA_g155.t1 [Chlamydomonas eustigma]
MNDLSQEDIISELTSLIDDDLKVISYKWLARNYGISANLAKRVLLRFAEERKERLRIHFLISGKAKDGAQVVTVVESGDVEGFRSKLDCITSSHIYSVAPAYEVDPHTLWQHELMQTQELLRGVTDGIANTSVSAFKNNQCSSVHFTQPPKRAGISVIPAGQLEPIPKLPLTSPKPEAEDVNNCAVEVKSVSKLGATCTAKSTLADKKSLQTPQLTSGNQASAATFGKSSGNALSKLSKMAGKTVECKLKEAKAIQASKVQSSQAEPSAALAAAAAVVASLAQPLDDIDEASSPNLAVKRSKRTVRIEDSDDEDVRENVMINNKELSMDFELVPKSSSAAALEARLKGNSNLESCEVNHAETDNHDEATVLPEEKKLLQKSGKKVPTVPGKRKKDQENMATDKSIKKSKSSKAVSMERTSEGQLPPETAPSSEPASSAYFENKQSATVGAKTRLLQTSYNEKGEEVTEEVWVDSSNVEEIRQPLAPVAGPVKTSIDSNSTKQESTKPVSGKSSGALKSKTSAGAQKGIMSFFGKK